MNRRRCIRRLAAGAAALVGAGMVAPRAVTAEPSEADRIRALVDDMLDDPGKHPELEAQVREMTGGSAERAVIYENDPLTLHLRAGAFTAEDVNAWMVTSKARCVQGAGMDQTVIHGPGLMRVTSATGVTFQRMTPTFEAIAAD